MNERIQNMLYQAINAMPEHLDFDIPQELAEKFAELLIKECKQSIEKTIEITCDTDSEKMGCEFAITDLLQHFGVEE